MNTWLKLSEGSFLFAPDSINRFEPIENREGRTTPYNTVLYNNTTKITVVKETEQEILDKLALKGDN